MPKKTYTCYVSENERFIRVRAPLIVIHQNGSPLDQLCVACQGHDTLLVIRDIMQLGFWADQHTMMCKCVSCGEYTAIRQVIWLEGTYQGEKADA